MMCGIDLKLGSTDLLFKGKGDKVDKHVHVFSNELTFVLSGEIELITRRYKYFKTGGLFYTYEQGHSYIFEIHFVIFTPK
jgi:hypothetical protein